MIAGSSDCPPQPGRRHLLLLAAAGLAALSGCSKSPAPPSPATQPAVRPRAAVTRIMQLRHERRYTELRTLIVPESAHEVIETLMAVDDFLDSNQKLCVWIRDHVGTGLAQTIDQSWMADIVGIFSRHVELLDESITGGRARIGFIVQDRLPAQCAELRTVQGAWRYDPGDGYSEHLPAAFHTMARGLDSVLADLESGRVPVEELLSESGLLEEKVMTRLRPGTNLLSKGRIAAEEAPAGQGTGR